MIAIKMDPSASGSRSCHGRFSLSVPGTLPLSWADFTAPTSIVNVRVRKVKQDKISCESSTYGESRTTSVKNDAQMRSPTKSCLGLCGAIIDRAPERILHEPGGKNGDEEEEGGGGGGANMNEGVRFI